MKRELIATCLFHSFVLLALALIIILMISLENQNAVTIITRLH